MADYPCYSLKRIGGGKPNYTDCLPIHFMYTLKGAKCILAPCSVHINAFLNPHSLDCIVLRRRKNPTFYGQV